MIRSSHDIVGQIRMCLIVELDLALVAIKVSQPTIRRLPSQPFLIFFGAEFAYFWAEGSAQMSVEKAVISPFFGLEHIYKQADTMFFTFVSNAKGMQISAILRRVIGLNVQPFRFSPILRLKFSPKTVVQPKNSCSASFQG